MAIPLISGVGAGAAATKLAQPALTAAAPPTAAANGVIGAAPTVSVSTTASSSMTSLVLDPASRPSNLALAYLILQMLLQGDDKKKDQNDPLIAGLLAGLLAAEQNRAPQLFFSSSHTSSSAQITTHPQQVSAAYNTEMPALAAGSPQSLQQANPTSVPKVDVRA